ncbi:HNH endonuclease [Serratia fonticola]
MISDLLKYEPTTGKIYWKNSRGGVPAGSEAGWIDSSSGYLRVSISGKPKYGHVLAWELFHGHPARGEIDHINGNKIDNRIENLRECSASQNCQNKKIRTDNKSGVKGVSWNTARRKWSVRLTVNKKVIFLGFFSSLDDAKKEISKCRDLYHGEFANHG